MKRLNLREPGLDGIFGLPDGAGPFVGVLALGGSEGGVPEYLLRLLVPEGFACLALAYFNTEATQPALVEVPLERIEQGLDWLRSRAEVETRQGRVSLIGVSKGAELALLTAATFPQLVGPVAAYTPSSVVWQGIDFGAHRPPMQSSWSFGGRPVPFLPYAADAAPSASERGLSLLPVYDRSLDTLKAGDAAAIQLERATGRVLLVSGGDDKMWPAARMCGMIVDRMQQAGLSAQVKHLSFPEAGHVLFPFEAPKDAQPPPMAFDLGGTSQAANHAHATAWPEVIRHLR